MKSVHFGQIPAVVSIAAVFVIIAGLMAAQVIVIPILLALFFSIIITQPIQWLVRKKVPLMLAIAIILLVSLILLVLLGGLIGNSLSQFSNDLPQYESELRILAKNTIDSLNDLGITIESDHVLNMLAPDRILGFTARAVGEIGGIMSNSFLILLIVIFIVAEINAFGLKAKVVQMITHNSLSYLNNIGNSIRRYLYFKTLVSILTGVLVTVWLMIIGVNYAVLWGVIAFLLNYIPNIGSIIAAVPTMLLALVQLGVPGMIWTGVGYIAVNMIIGNVVEPKVMGKGLGLSTLVVFLSLMLWGYIFGTVGMFLSVPLTMCIKITLEDNEKTKWISVMLGTEVESKKMLEQKQNQAHTEG